MARRTELKSLLDELGPEDWPQVTQIYQEGIATGHATFQAQVPPWKEWDRSHRKDCRIVLRRGAKLLGWAALSPVSGRCVYGGVAEVSVYVASSCRGQGLGSVLLSELIRRSEEAGLWTLEAGIFPENMASLRIHQNLGFRVVGTRAGIGQMSGRWRDVVLLERRSSRVGVD